MSFDYTKFSEIELNEKVNLRWDQKKSSFYFSNYRIYFDLIQGCCEMPGVLLEVRGKKKNEIKYKKTVINDGTKNKKINLGLITNAYLRYNEYEIETPCIEYGLPVTDARVSGNVFININVKEKNYKVEQHTVDFYDNKYRSSNTFSLSFSDLYDRARLIFFNIHEGYYPHEFKIYKKNNSDNSEELLFVSYI